jgi:hypothetical protein
MVTTTMTIIMIMTATSSLMLLKLLNLLLKPYLVMLEELDCQGYLVNSIVYTLTMRSH